MKPASLLQALPLAVRLAIFQVLEAASALRQPRANTVVSDSRPRTRSLWVFVSTIGELNAIQPFLTSLLHEMAQPALTLISDRASYGEAFRSRYPAAELIVTDGSTAQAKAMARNHPPLMLLVAEIPALLHDAPCRFSFAMLHAARSAGAPAVLVNGWLYGYTPPSRMDHIENALFRRDYVRHFDLLMVQTDAIKRQMLAAGAADDKVHVTGNIKFDAMQTDFVVPAHAPLRDALRLRAATDPVVVAGSVTDPVHLAVVLDAFVRLRSLHPGALLVVAPRHPEKPPVMRALAELLDNRGLRYRLRSQHQPADATERDVMVLDTMGELRGCYSAATLAYVGVDHNVLEPLAFGTPVFVSPGWEATYPSYPVYSLLLEAGALQTAIDADDLAARWAGCIARRVDPHADDAMNVEQSLSLARGAVQRCLNVMRSNALLAPGQHPARTA